MKIPIMFFQMFEQNTQNSCLEASKLWRPGFSNTPKSLKVALRAISKNTNNAFSKGLCVYQNTNSSASKLWMPGLKESIFLHLLQPEPGPESGNRNYQ